MVKLSQGGEFTGKEFGRVIESIKLGKVIEETKQVKKINSRGSSKKLSKYK